MSTTTEITQQVSSQASPPDDIELTATVPWEMEQSQAKIIDWIESKLGHIESERRELQEALDIAKKNKWATKVLENHVRKSVKRITYYEKIKAALEAGFYIVPNFPVEIFAIRTDSKNPRFETASSKWVTFEQEAKPLPVGDGEYKNPIPVIVESSSISKDPITKELKKEKYYFPDEWKEEIPFPIIMAKPKIMEATSRAMALKIFDQFGVLPSVRKQDPIIVGQVKFKDGYNEKLVTFLLAWHLNTSML